MFSTTVAPYLVLLASLIAGLLIWFRLIKPRWRKMQEYIKNACTCGCLPPTPTPESMRFGIWLSNVLVWWQLGRVKFIGEENLDTSEPLVISSNHNHYIDGFLIAVELTKLKSVKRPTRYMAAQGVMAFGGGLGALLLAPLGAFAADLEKGKGGPAKEAAVRLLREGQNLVIFPEGWAWMDGEMGPFKKGAVRIAKIAENKLEKPVFVVPISIRYGNYPGSWIRKIPPALAYFWVFAFSWLLYRRGATIVIGKPIPADTLPADDGKATEFLRQRIIDQLGN